MGRTRCTIVAIIGIALLAGSGGCTRRLRALEGDDQVLLEDRRSIFQNADGIEGLARPVRVPWGTTASPVGLRLELTNFTETPVRVWIQGIALHDASGRIIKPLPPERLLRAFGAGSKEQTRVRIVAHHGLAIRRHSYRYCRPRIRRYPYSWGPSFGWGIGYYSPAYYYDPYAEERRVARFLSELLIDQTVAPDHVAVGYVVFPCRLQEDDELTLVVPVYAVGAAPPARPTTNQPMTTLSFRFEVD